MMTGTTAEFAASIARAMPFSDACGLSIQRPRESFPSVTVTLRVEDSQATDPPNASITARIGTRVLPATMTGFVPWASIGCCTPLTDMDALPIHSLTVVDDRAVAADGARSPTTRRIATKTFSRRVLLIYSPLSRTRYCTSKQSWSHAIPTNILVVDISANYRTKGLPKVRTMSLG